MAQASNTDLADINEILVGYYMNNEKWFDTDAKKQHDSKRKKLTPEQYERESGRARAMVEDIKKWAKANGYSLPVKKIWWTARPGDLSKATGVDVDSRNNPTDTLFQFAKGPSDGFLGISAKSTGGSKDIGFKNPGAGTLDKILNINMSGIATKKAEEAIAKYDLPKVAKDRKKYIRADKALMKETRAMGAEALKDIRDLLLKKLQSMPDDKALDHIMSNWMDSGGNIFPPYIKVTGMGKKPPYTSKITDPLKNSKVAQLTQNKISFEKSGDQTIDVKAGGKKVFKIRAKYTSEPITSSVKFSADPA